MIRELDHIVASLRDGYDPSLPITARRDEIVELLRGHQVVVIAGETGSGKSTQLPKMCLEVGRGTERLIGHTQPRRVAARSIAQRIAAELGTTVGGLVGSSVRFDDRVGADTAIRVMTDGILLAELQRDPMLDRYDTIIVDEAHERSLNVDFLLGYLRQLLPRRPDLSVIVTSATIDTERFAAHFADADGAPAPIVEVTGRTYPVERRYRPLVSDDGRDIDQVQAVCEAVEELMAEGPGDVLVFFSGEREIHDAADAIRGLGLPGVEVLPLYARLSSSEQQRVFQSHPGRRIVLATNVAETSITVPGVRYVVDTGTARISRYSRRLKVQQLPIEPISRASADQRAGRCGRVAPGICIRLYDEEDLEGRAEFTEPEILRTNLASVILQMTALGLGDVADFPFVEAPDRRAIKDGYLLLGELGAIRASGGDGVGEPRLTRLGRRLARLPVDPRLGRMVLEAERQDCVREVLVIAAALSIQDPRERPHEHQQAAAEMHRRFDVAGSDLLSTVALWDHLRARQREMSSNQFRKLCRAEFLHHLRVREWHDLFSQLRRVAGELGIRPGTEAAHPDRVHRAVLAGHLSHIGMRDPQRRDYRGARGSRFVIGRGSVLAPARRQRDSSSPDTDGGSPTRPGTSARWVVAAELVETDRLYARRVAAIRPEWIEQLGEHLVTRSYGEPRWDASAGRAVVGESVSLFGLPIVDNRTIGLDRVDPTLARTMFIRDGLVDQVLTGDGWRPRKGGLHGFARRNRRFAERVAAWEQRVRRADLLDRDTLERFFDERIGPDVVSLRHFDRWWERARHEQPDLLDLTDEVIDVHLDQPVGTTDGRGRFRFDDWPDTWVVRTTGGTTLELALSYRFEPGSALDGVAVHVPLTVLMQLPPSAFDRHVSGHRGELVDEMLRTLPKDIRRRLIPMDATVADVLDEIDAVGAGDDRPFAEIVADALTRVRAEELRGCAVTASMFDLDRLEPYLRPVFVVEGDDAEVLDAGRDLAAIARRLAATAREAIAAAAPIEERTGIRTWTADTIGTVPAEIRVSAPDGTEVSAYPTLLDDGETVSLRVVTRPELQARLMRAGVRRLLLLGLGEVRRPSGGRGAAPLTPRDLARRLGKQRLLALTAAETPVIRLAEDCLAASVDRLLDESVARDGLPFDHEAYGRLEATIASGLAEVALDAIDAAADAVVFANAARARLDRMSAPALLDTVVDARAHLDRLAGPGFVARAGTRRLPDVVRYVQGIDHRLANLGGDIDRDHRRMAEVVPLERRWATLVRAFDGRPPPELTELGWAIEELRISLFAQSLGVRTPRVIGKVSATRIARALDDLSH
ncbi:MAG: ATP-dependent RNA helicase HrpA [Nocardiopsis sp. BM-2018]|nr:MAG: ATP-dependent RNA helicase HrpA [Nocardiopsis sp. BM-2018]